jgi:endonuclease I
MSKKILLFVQFVVLSTSILLAQIPTDYYKNAEGKSGEALKDALYEIIKGHTEYPYTSTSTDVWDILKETDRDPANAENVILIYTGWSVNAAQEYNNGQGWTREHVWAKSRGDFGTDLGAGTDAHHLRPCDNTVNTARNNRWFAECSEPYVDGDVATESFTSYTDWVWKPRAAVKGDVARMIFYMATRYEGENGEPDLEMIDYIPADNNTNEPIHALKSDLLRWHQEDPVDNFERNRNEVIYSYQNNRNPFIDHPEFVSSIWNPTAVNLSLAENIRVFPNPATSTLYVDGLKDATYSIINILGRQVQQGKLGSEAVDISVLPQGKYIILIEDKASVIAKSFVKLP